MSAPRFEVVRTDADEPWHARSRAGNGEVVLWSETYTERRAALEAIRITAQLFSVTPAYFDVTDGVFYLYAGGMRVEVRDVDERAVCPVTDIPDCPWHPDGGNHPGAAQ